MAVLTHSQLETLWELAGGTRATADTAAAIAHAESGGDTTRINNTAYPKLPGYHPPAPGNLPEYSVGLWQINELAHPSYTTTQLLTQLGNANAAEAIERTRGNFTDWSTFKDGSYAQFLQSGGTPTPQPGTVSAASATYRPAQAFSGWADLRQSVNHHLQNQVQRSRRSNAATLRLLAHRHRVGH